MAYVIMEPSGSYFVEASYESWGLTADVEEADTFQTEEAANGVAAQIKRAISVTYWDYWGIIPYPTVVEI